MPVRFVTNQYFKVIFERTLREDLMETLVRHSLPVFLRAPSMEDRPWTKVTHRVLHTRATHMHKDAHFYVEVELTLDAPAIEFLKASGLGDTTTLSATMDEKGVYFQLVLKDHFRPSCFELVTNTQIIGRLNDHRRVASDWDHQRSFEQLVGDYVVVYLYNDRGRKSILLPTGENRFTQLRYNEGWEYHSDLSNPEPREMRLMETDQALRHVALASHLVSFEP